MHSNNALQPVGAPNFFAGLEPARIDAVIHGYGKRSMNAWPQGVSAVWP